jgi:DNA-binding MarR family transcriptional regulator
MSDERLDRDLWLFHLAFRQLIKIPDQLLAQRGLGRIHHRILFIVGRSGAVAVGTIAERLEVTRQALHGPMRDLRSGGLITSHPSAENRTVQLVSLTKRGIALEHELNELQRQHLKMAFDRASKAGEEGWRQVMLSLSELLPEAVPATGAARASTLENRRPR